MTNEAKHVHRARKKAPRFVREPTATALDAIGRLEPGDRLVGMTKGQFSLLDLIRAVLRSTGPAHLTVSTWTTGIRDAENARLLVSRGDLLSLRLLTDRSFPSRQPKYCAAIIRTFGADSIWCTRTHAKFALIRNDQWNVVIRSSMNLNRNPRFEQFDLDDDAEMADWFEAHVSEIAETMKPGLDFTTHEADVAFERALGGGVSELTPLGSDDDEGGAVKMDWSPLI